MPNTVASRGTMISINNMKCPTPVSRYGQARLGSSQRSVADHCAERLACGLHKSPQRASRVQHSEQMAPR